VTKELAQADGRRPIPSVPANYTFNAHDGEVMVLPRVRAGYWGSAYGSAAGGSTALGQSLDNFFASIFPTAYFGFLAE
jgi:hypothetical protein